MSEGLVDPEMIPRIDTGCVTDAAQDLRAMGGSVAENTDAMVAAWAGLRAEGVYEAPEAETVYSLLDPAVAAAGEVESALGGAADALDVFAEELEEIRPGLEELRAEAAEFRARALSGVDEPASKSPVFVPSYGAGSFRSGEGKTEHKQWWESAVMCEQNSKLLARINDQVARIINAENECVNVLHGLIPDQCFMQQPTDLTGDVLDRLGDLPWGGPTEYQSRNCVESAVLGLGDAVKDMVAGGASLLSYDPRTGKWGDWGSAGQAWAGLGNLGLSLAVALSPSTMVVDVSRVFGVDNQATRLAGDSRRTLGETLAGLVNIDPTADDPFAAWKKNGMRSAVSAGVNIGTFFIPGAEVGDAIKGAGLAGKAGRMALRGAGAFADTVVPGGSFAVKAGEAGLRAADVAAHAGEGAGLASRAARAIENGALHNPITPDPGRAGVPSPTHTGLSGSGRIPGIDSDTRVDPWDYEWSSRSGRVSDDAGGLAEITAGPFSGAPEFPRFDLPEAGRLPGSLPEILEAETARRFVEDRADGRLTADGAPVTKDRHVTGGGVSEFEGPSRRADSVDAGERDGELGRHARLGRSGRDAMSDGDDLELRGRDGDRARSHDMDGDQAGSSAGRDRWLGDNSGGGRHSDAARSDADVDGADLAGHGGDRDAFYVSEDGRHISTKYRDMEVVYPDDYEKLQLSSDNPDGSIVRRQLKDGGVVEWELNSDGEPTRAKARIFAEGEWKGERGDSSSDTAQLDRQQREDFNKERRELAAEFEANGGDGGLIHRSKENYTVDDRRLTQADLDAAGHILAYRFLHPDHGGGFNFMSQNGSFNSGRYLKWENEIAEALQSSEFVDVTAEIRRPSYPPHARPESISLEWRRSDASPHEEFKIRKFLNERTED